MESTIQIFEDRKDYHNYDQIALQIENLSNFSDPSPIDLWYDKNFYGKVNQQNDYIYISKRAFELQEKLTLISDRGLYVLEFVAAAYNDFKNRIDRLIAFGGDFAGPSISKLSVLKSISPQRAYDGPVEDSYDAYINAYFDNFTKNYLRGTSRDEKIKNFDDYVYQFLQFVGEKKNKLPFTKSGFIGSIFCSPYSSGLVIDLAHKDHNDDLSREAFIEDESFDFYHSLAKQYGFYVDKNAPWRLVANISSPQMQRYWIRQFIPPTPRPEISEEDLLKEACKDILFAEDGVEVQNIVDQLKDKFLDGMPGVGPVNYMFPVSLEDLFSKYYTKAYHGDLEQTIMKLVEGYNKYVSTFPKIIEEKEYSCFKQIHELAGSPVQRRRLTSKKTIIRKKVTEKDLVNRSASFFLKIYLNIRNKEEGNTMSQAKFNKTILQATRYYMFVDQKQLDKGATLKYINDVIKGQKTQLSVALPFEATESGDITGQKFYGMGSTESVSDMGQVY